MKIRMTVEAEFEESLWGFEEAAAEVGSVEDAVRWFFEDEPVEMLLYPPVEDWRLEIVDE